MMKIALFLGAGASVQFEKPTTKQFRDHMQNDDVQTSMFLDTLLGRSEFSDIEHVLQCVVDLLALKNTYAGKYFEFSKTTTPSEDGKTYRFDQLMATAKNAEDVILTELFRKYRWNPVHDPDLKEFYDGLFTILYEHTDKIYLGTTNYDQAIEIFCNQSRKKYQCIDNFKLEDGGHHIWDTRSFDYNYDPKQGKPIFLYKIHGSLNWFHYSERIRRDLTEPDYERNASGPHHVFVAPTLSPKDAEKVVPYGILRDEFVKQLKDCDVCIVIGFSFRDEVIAKHFKDFVHSEKRLIIISPSCRDNYCKNLQRIQPPFESIYKRDEWLDEQTKRRSLHLIDKPMCKGNNSDIVKEVSDILSK